MEVVFEYGRPYQKRLEEQAEKHAKALKEQHIDSSNTSKSQTQMLLEAKDAQAKDLSRMSHFAITTLTRTHEQSQNFALQLANRKYEERPIEVKSLSTASCARPTAASMAEKVSEIKRLRAEAEAFKKMAQEESDFGLIQTFEANAQDLEDQSQELQNSLRFR